MFKPTALTVVKNDTFMPQGWARPTHVESVVKCLLNNSVGPISTGIKYHVDLGHRLGCTGLPTP